MRALLTCAAILACTACNKPAATEAPAVDTEAEIAAIKQVEQAQIRAIQAKDGVGSAANYAEDAVFVGEDGKPVQGGEAIRSAFAEMTKDPALAFEYEQDKMVVSKGGDMGYSTASYTFTSTDKKSGKPVTTKGANLSVWQKQVDGRWKLVADNNAGSAAE